jgi:hypothetical protein
MVHSRGSRHYALWMCPGLLYLDIKTASDEAGVWDLRVTPWSREYDFTAADLDAALLSGGYGLA